MKAGSTPEDRLQESDPLFRPPAGSLRIFIEAINQRLAGFLDRSIPDGLWNDPEQVRRARLITRFGLLGSLFGITYATFYLLIGHRWGFLIILVCSLAFAMSPVLMRWRGSVDLAGNFLALILALGFTALCCVEGGLKGHAIAWLVSVPLCSLLLVGQRSGRRWAVISFLAAGVVAGVDLAGKTLPTTFDPRWNPVVSSAGYLGLILFMFILALIFEAGRARAYSQLCEAHEELARSNERLVHLNTEKNEFLGIAAHDLKNPLTVIACSAEMMKSPKDQAHLDRLANHIGSAAARMSQLITNLLDVNAIEQGRFTSNVERCDLGVLVGQSVENNQPAASRKKIAFRIGVSEGRCAAADKAATLQILDNLISNAVKYSPPNTTVHVHTLPEKDFVRVTVRDEGPGISETDQMKLFQKFTRLSAVPTGGESSTGLGLAIVKRLAEAMSGTIECRSALGSGANFSVRLPVWTDDGTDRAAAAAAGESRIEEACRKSFQRAPALN